MPSAIYRRAAGNIGAAVTKFLAPFVLLAWGWQTVAQAWAVALVVMAVVFWFTTDDDPAIRQRHAGAETPKGFLAEFAPLKNQQVWRFAPPELVTPTVRASETDRPRGHRNRALTAGVAEACPSGSRFFMWGGSGGCVANGKQVTKCYQMSSCPYGWSAELKAAV
jgi:hypothetical protein